MTETKRGRLGVAAIAAANTAESVYSVTASMSALVSIFLTNPTNSNITTKVAIVDGNAASLATEDYIKDAIHLQQGGSDRVLDVRMNANEQVVITSDRAGIVCRVDGVEEDAPNPLGVRKLTSQALAFGSFTDNGNTTGYIDFSEFLPAGAMVLGWKSTVSAGFAGDTTAVMQVGVSGDVDAFSADTAQSCLAAGVIGSASLASTSATPIATASTPRVTVTGGADFGSISAGSMIVDVFYIPTTESAVTYSGSTYDIQKLSSQSLAYGDFTDNGNTTGYLDFTTGQLPAGAIVLGWKAVTTTGFTGDTTAVAMVGISGDTDAYSASTTGSVLAAGTIGSAALAATAATPIATASTPRVTVTGGADFGEISAGVMTVDIYYLKTA